MREMRRTTKSEMLRYAFGGMGSNIPFFFLMMFATYYYVDVFGISPLAMAGVFVLSRIIDAVTDPLMGMLSDRTKSKFGRFRPWILWGAPLLGIAVFLMFASPDLSPTLKVVYAYITYIAYSLLSTVVNIPYHSLTAVLSEDPDQRTTIATVKQGFAVFGMVFGYILVVPVTTALIKGGMSPVAAWRLYALVLGILTTLSFWLCQSGAVRHDKMENLQEDQKEHLPFKEQFKLITKNQPLLMLLIAFGTDMVAYAVANGVNLFFFIYYLGRPDLFATVAMFGIFAMVVVYPFLPKIVKTFGKKNVYLTCTSLLIASFTVWYFVPAEAITIHLIMAFLTASIGLLPGVLGWSMLTDCVDYAEWKLGVRGEGTVTSLLPFVNKLGMAVGGGLVGVLLAASGYAAQINGQYQAQTEGAILAIRQMKFFFPVAGYVFSLISMRYYKLNRPTMAEMKAALLAKHS